MDLKALLQLLILMSVVRVAHFSKSSYKGRYMASVFSDLTSKEMTSVQTFLVDQKQLNLVPIRSHFGKNSIFMMELNLPKKQDVLNFLDYNGPKPKREAKVVIIFGDQVKPNITEYIVGPLTHPYYYRPLTTKGNKHIRFESRPMTYMEYNKFQKRLLELINELDHILVESSGFSFNNCSSRCLRFTDIDPWGLKSGERRSWMIVQKDVEGFFLHPIGIEILLNHRSLNPKEWTIEKIWYNGQYFDSVKELVRKYEKNELPKLPLSDDSQDTYSTFMPRGKFKTKTDRSGPSICEPQGKRYQVLGNYVEYTGWSFAYRICPSAGLQIFDIQYNNERIAYEVSIQEAIAFYSGATPAGMQTKYIDSSWGLGTEHYELAKGIDCPEGATYQDLYSYYDTDKPLQYKNALCIFEQPTAIPLRRHFDINDNGGYNFYAGMENQVLVVRTTSTVYNYDYIWDFLFYQNGVIEVKMSATGYIHATFFTPDGLQFGNRVQSHVLGNLHTHLVNYKVDLDIAGTENSFETIDLKYENISNPWSPDHFIVQSRLDRVPRISERQAAFRFGSHVPRYLAFQNPNKKNKWGHQKSYRIQYNSHAQSVLPEMWAEEKGVSWSRYSLAVTRQKDTEQSSSSIYIQGDPWDPAVYFENFISDNEDIVNKDLVAWVTVGFLHIPHAEDIPNTSTPGNSVGFFLRPFNFFDEDPSVASRDIVIVRPTDKGFTKVNIQRWTPEVISQCVSGKPFHYNGTYVSD
ncbi:amiloride-sensitive amine oxidase [copper-containing]-like [Bufo bufo]|uniref:amiloride-sensitive amine oxidase [copper-containing]-like n=1 Tax=Bufo bufo TaxID=8384 RepID=UPI001ABE4F62|nr:amiloride-sensitive amine oxidase [copper-containing]-like [Bufo bufo]